jgi:hypothetical protein
VKKHWRWLVGASILAGSLLLKKKQAPTTAATTDELQHIYTGKWFFVDPSKATEHILEIHPTFALFINEKKINAQLVELTPQRFAVQDEFGYHLIVQCQNGKPTSLYDEADDKTYPLTEVTI